MTLNPVRIVVFGRGREILKLAQEKLEVLSPTGAVITVGLSQKSVIV